jgi:hypothetical protein
MIRPLYPVLSYAIWYSTGKSADERLCSLYTIQTEESKRSLLSTPTTTLPLLIGNETINKTDGIIIMMIYTISITAPILQSGST